MSDFDGAQVESMRQKLSAAGPITTAVMYNNGKDLGDAMTAAGVQLGFYGNLDGGEPDSTYGGINPIDAGGPA